MREKAWSVAAVTLLCACGAGGDAARSSETQASAASPPCASILQEYSAALLDAVSCDPAAEDWCGAPRPVAVFEQRGESAVLTDICDCRVMVNSRRTEQLDRILREYEANGCRIGVCPCPPNDAQPHSCRALAEGGGTCQ